MGSRGVTAAGTDRPDLLDLATQYESLEKWAFGLWLVGVLVLLTVGQWVAGVQCLVGNIRAWPLGAELAALAPVIGSLLAIWAAFYWFEQRLDCHHEKSGWQLRGGLIRFLWFQARQQLGLLVVPPLALAGLVDLAAWAGLGGTRLLGDHMGPTDGWWVIGMPLGMVLAMPLVLRRLWKTTPLPEGHLRQELVSHCQARRCPVSEVLLWHTGMRQANAAVVGLLPRLRYVLISDRLLAVLTRGELLAVLRHELSHLKRGHLLLRLAALVLPVAVWLVCFPSDADTAAPIRIAGAAVAARLVPDAQKLAPSAHDAPDQCVLVTPSQWASFAFPGAMLAYCVLVVGGYSRWLEHEADLDACLDERGRFDPWAAEDLADALRVVVGRDEGTWLVSWLHPPLSARLAFLRRVQHDAAFVRRFRGRLRGAAVLLVTLWLAAGWMVWLGT